MTLWTLPHCHLCCQRIAPLDDPTQRLEVSYSRCDGDGCEYCAYLTLCSRWEGLWRGKGERKPAGKGLSASICRYLTSPVDGHSREVSCRTLHLYHAAREMSLYWSHLFIQHWDQKRILFAANLHCSNQTREYTLVLCRSVRIIFWVIFDVKERGMGDNYFNYFTGSH